MPVTIVNNYCPNCRCDLCHAMRNPVTGEEIGRRVADEIFDKVEAKLKHRT